MESLREPRLVQRVYTPAMGRALVAGAVLGVLIYLALLPSFAGSPRLALQLLWFLFIPLAPMILIAAPNVWVSLCPMSSLQSAARVLGSGGGIRLSSGLSRRLQLAGWLLMFLGIPSRHLLFNTSGPAMIGAVGAATAITLVVGFFTLTLSGWCMGACPIRPVEVIYGQWALDRNRPVKCGGCDACVSSCVRLQPDRADQELGRSRWTSVLAQAFPGFVASYFLLDLAGWCHSERAFFAGDVAAPGDPIAHAALVYGVMTLAALLSFLVFHTLGRLGLSAATRFRAVAISAYSFYYLGAAPEIAMAWSLDPSWIPVLLSLPAAVLATVLLAGRARVAQAG